VVLNPGTLRVIVDRFRVLHLKPLRFVVLQTEVVWVVTPKFGILWAEVVKGLRGITCITLWS
jgi:hypothetical protein